MHASLALALLALSPAAVADVLVVGPPGSGAEFTDFPLAVFTAEPGDQIQLLPGTYLGATVDKPLEIIGSGADQTVILAANIFATSMAVTGLSAGESVHMADIGFESQSTALVPYAVSVTSCLGTVSIDRCSLGRADNALSVGGLSAVDAELVLLSDCSLAATDLGVLAGTSGPALPAVHVERSTAVFERCAVQGGGVGPMTVSVSASGIRGGDGVRAIASTVVVSNSELRGGSGGAFLAGTYVGTGGSGLLLAGGVAILGGASSVIGADGETLPGLTPGAGGTGLLVQSAAAVQIDPDVIVAGGVNAQGPGSAPAITAPAAASVQLLTERFTTLTAVNDDGLGQAGVDLTATGEPGRTLLVFADLGPAPATFLPLVGGPLLLDPITARQVATLVIPGSGAVALSVSTTAPGAQPGKPATFQALELDPLTGLIRTSLPAGATLSF